MKARHTREMGSRSTGARAARWAGCALAAGAAAALATCVRHADIRDEPDAALVQPPPQIDAGDLPDLDSGLGTDAYPACIDRPLGDCKGTVDFPCSFETWVNSTAAGCQESTGCNTNGWLEVQMGPSGCVDVIGMDEPNDEVVACLLAEFGSVRCPCLQGQSKHFFGYGNTGVCGE